MSSSTHPGGDATLTAIDETYDPLKRLALRTMLRRADPELGAGEAQELEARLAALAGQWRHDKLTRPAVIAAVIVHTLAPVELEASLKALDGAPSAPSQRVVALAMMVLAARLDLDDGVALPDCDQRRVCDAIIAWVVLRLGFEIGGMDAAAANAIWEDVELEPRLWTRRVKRLSEAYEREKYGS